MGTTAVDAGRLSAWLHEHVGGLGDGPLDVEVIAGGASNLTLVVTGGDRRVVVRRPPEGSFLPTAHDVLREHRILRALHGTAVPVPEPLAACDDVDVLGVPFYVMAHVDGVIPHGPEALDGASAPTNRRTAESYVGVLAALHATDVDAVGLGTLAKRHGYLERQIARWTDQWARSRLADTPAIDELADVLAHRRPPQVETTLVHGDYRLGNVILDRHDAGRILAVLDWEMATLGDPRTDLGYALLWWGSVDRPATHPSQAVADLPGFPSPTELVASYEAASGRDCGDVAWFVALAAFKLAVIGEGQRARLLRTGGDVGDVSRTQSAEPLATWALHRLG